MRKLEKINKYLWFQEGPGVRKEQYRTEGIKLLNVSNLVNGEIDLSNSDRYVSVEEGTGKYAHFLCDVGDLIIASSGIKVEYFDKKMGFIESNHLPLCMNTSTIRFKSISKDVNLRYFMYYLKSEHFKKQLAFNITGSAQLNFGPSHLNKMEFYLYNLEKQLEIIKILDEINNLISYKKKEIEKLDNLIKSQFIEMFGDVDGNEKCTQTLPMTELCEIIDGDRGKNYPKQEEFFEEGYCLFLNAKNVTPNGFSFENCMYITEEKDKILRNGKLSRGDVVLTTRGTIGNLAFYDESVSFEHIRINSGMVILRMKYYIVERFFIEQFKMKLTSIKNKIASGSAQPQLPISTMNKIVMLVPPIELQNQFAAIVEQIDKSKYILQKQINALQELLDSKMEEFFG